VSRRYLVLGLGTILGYGLWAAWVNLLGRGSPWNGGAPYLASLFVVGLILGALDRVHLWPGPLGVYLGQALAMSAQAFLGLSGKPAAPLPRRWLFLVSLTLATALGAAVSAGLRIWIGEGWRGYKSGRKS